LSATPDLLSLLQSLRRRWLLAAVLGILLGSAASVGAWYSLTPPYTASAQIHILYNEPNVIPGETGTNTVTYPIYLRSQIALMRSRPVLQAALKRDEVRRLHLEAKHLDPASFLEQGLRIDANEGSEFVTLVFSAPDPIVATTLVKAITDSYMDYISYGDKNTKTQRIAELKAAFDRTKGNISRDRKRLKDMADSLGTNDKDVLSRQREDLLGNIREIQGQRMPIHMEILRTQSELNSFEDRIKLAKQSEVKEEEVQAALANDPASRPLMARLATLQTIVLEFGDRNSPTRIRAEDSLGDVEKALAKRREVLRSELRKHKVNHALEDGKFTRIRLENLIVTLKDHLKTLEGEARVLMDQASKLRGSSLDMDNLMQDIAREEKVKEDVGNRLQVLEVNKDAPERTVVHQTAELMPQDNKRQVMATVAAPFGVLLVVCVGVALFDHRQRRIHTASEIAGGLGIRVVGSVPNLPHLERHLLDPANDPELEGHSVLESIDAIRTVLLRESQVEETRVVMVSSAMPGEGKTTLAGHLAASLARAGRKTLLIDGDLRRPALHELFELPMQPGFSEILLGEVETADAIQPTQQAGLAVIAAGQWDREVLHALARDGLAGILEKAREDFDFIIVDSHPVLPATDSLLIGQHVDAVILAVLRQVSQMPRVYTATQRLTALGIRVLGAVVNGTDPEEVITGKLVSNQAMAA